MMATDRMDEFNGKGGRPSSRVQIEALEKTRLYPQRRWDLTPAGLQWEKRLNARDVKHNLELDAKQNAMRKRLARQAGKAKRSIEQATDRRSGKDRRGLGR